MIFQMYLVKKPDMPLGPEWHWTLNRIAGNAQIAASHIGFETKELCEANIQLIMLTDWSTPVVEIT